MFFLVFVDSASGDTRMGSMETMPALVRALIAVQQHGAHMINMSYGESAAWTTGWG